MRKLQTTTMYNDSRIYQEAMALLPLTLTLWFKQAMTDAYQHWHPVFVCDCFYGLQILPRSRIATPGLRKQQFHNFLFVPK